MYCRYISGVIKLKFFFKKGLIPALLKALAQVLLNYINSRPIPALLKSLAQTFLNYTDSRPIPALLYRPFKFYSFKTYTNAFESIGIGSTYSSAFKSAGIGYIQIFVKAVLTQVKTSEQDLKSTRTYPGTFEQRWYRFGDPIPTFKPRRFEAPGKKTLGQEF